MARPKEFDTDAALDRAMDIFWCSGYDGTSVNDLTEGLGIGKGSLYGTFGSKDDLYARALDRYAEKEGGDLLACLDSDAPALERLRALFDLGARSALDDPQNRGCFMLNAALERAPHDEATAERVRRAMGAFEQQFRRLLEEARAAGEIDGDTDVRELARFLTTAFQGVRVMAKATRDERLVADSIAVALRAVA